jgi:hypothetical protein
MPYKTDSGQMTFTYGTNHTVHQTSSSEQPALIYSTITQFTRLFRRHFATDCRSVLPAVQPLIDLMAIFC